MEHESNYELFSDKFVKVFPKYVLDKRCRILPGTESARVNFFWLKDLLLSKDLSRNNELDWIQNGKEFRFLDGQDIIGEQVCLQSFPKTGNSLLRRILELITGVHTGSDMNIDLTLALALQGRLAGETVVSHDNLVWITKTHWPMAFPSKTE